MIVAKENERGATISEWSKNDIRSENCHISVVCGRNCIIHGSMESLESGAYLVLLCPSGVIMR